MEMILQASHENKNNMHLFKCFLYKKGQQYNEIKQYNKNNNDI